MQQLAPIQQHIQQADQALQRHEAAHALEAVQAASEQLNTLQPLIARLKSIGAQLEATEEALSSLPPTHAPTVQELVTQGRSAMERAAQHILRPSAQEYFDEAAWLADHSFKLGPDFEQTKHDLRQRLDDLQKQFVVFEQRLEQGRQEFDSVDDYAPSAWSDIRGNGSEATAAVAQAQQLTQQAQQEISDSMGDWAQILEFVETAEARLGYADQLLTAITTRLHDIHEAQKKAASEVENARRDVKLGWGYVRNNDADVGAAPEQALEQAETVLQAIDEQLQTGRPDWIYILRQAAQARQLADKALAGARSEVEAMQSLRQRVDDVAQAAQAELNKLQQFAQVHPMDVTAEQRRQIGLLTAENGQAATLVQQADQTEEEARTGRLEQAFEQYSNILEQAQPLYTAMYEEFQKLESLRTEANTMTQTARQSIDNTAAWYTSYGQGVAVSSQGRDLLEQAQRSWRSFNPRASEAELREVIEANKQANQLAHQSAEIIQQAAREYQSLPQQQRRGGMDLDDMLTGMMVGQMLGGGNRDQSWGHGWGGDWGGGSRRGGSIFGGGSGGGGGSIFGGGGGSSGSWGGGGSSGSWGGGGSGGGGSDSGSW